MSTLDKGIASRDLYNHYEERREKFEFYIYIYSSVLGLDLDSILLFKFKISKKRLKTWQQRVTQLINLTSISF